MLVSKLKSVSLKTKFGEVTIINVGASIVAINIPDKNGKLENVILNYSDENEYLKNPFYLGATIGRVAGRIGNGEFKIGDKQFNLKKNDNSKNHLHGGLKGFSTSFFSIENLIQEEDFASVDLTYQSFDGEEGYPGNLKLKVQYRFKHNSLKIIYKAETDQTSPLNITNHSYFNLSAKLDKSSDQELYINSTHILETYDDYIPTGKIINIEGTAHDFSKLIPFKTQKNKLLNWGFNEYYLINKTNNIAAVIYDRLSGRILKIKTSYPGILFYSGDFLSQEFKPCDGICIEAQHYPNSVNQSIFPSILLYPDEVYEQFIQFDFSLNYK